MMVRSNTGFYKNLDQLKYEVPEIRSVHRKKKKIAAMNNKDYL